MTDTLISQAFEVFVCSAEGAGFVVMRESHMQSFGSALARVVNHEGELRLIWGGKDEQLTLQISHGPSSNPRAAGWLELFASRCPLGLLTETEEQSVAFQSAVEYGIELMLPSGST